MCVEYQKHRYRDVMLSSTPNLSRDAVKRGKTCAVEGVYGAERYTLKPSSFVAVRAGHGRVDVCQGVKVLVC